MDTIHTGENEDRKLIKMANQANTMLLCLHIYLLLMFVFTHIWLMACFNIISLVVYGSNYYWSGKNLKIYFVSAYVEILVHMILAVIAVGWDCGFQIYVFALVLIIYFGDYISSKQKENKINLHPRLISVFVIILYPFLYLESHVLSPLYRIERVEVKYVVFILNAMFVLIFFVVFVDFFLKFVLQTEARLVEAAGKDALTHMNNRRSMQEMMRQLTSDGERQIAVAILDIDDFKKVNDTYGHNAGDAVLHRTAGHILERETESMISCRWGGEEFLILSEGETAYEQLVSVIGEILSAVQQDSYCYENSMIRLTMSAGISKLRPHERIEHAISRADQCLYQAKRDGKNRFVEERQVAFPKG
ncbi:MAG: GGDEF domain-containing protein [Agathobacter sp.]